MAEEILACLSKLVEELPGGALDGILDQAELVWRAGRKECRAIDISLRDLLPAAVSLSELQLGPGVCETAAGVLQAESAVGCSYRALAACRAASVVLSITACQVHYQECHLEPAVVLDLASCANVALGTAVQAAQLLFREAINTSEPTSSGAWTVLAATCCAILKTAAQAALLVVQLRGQNPAPALLAGVCRPDKEGALCYQLAPMLVQCQEKGVDVRAALEGLCLLLGHHSELETADRVLQGGPSSPALASLALHHYASQCLWLLGQPHGTLTVTAPSACPSPTTLRAASVAAAGAGAAGVCPMPPLWLEQYTLRLAQATYFLLCTKPWQELKVPGTVVTHMAAAVLILQRLTARGLVAWGTLEEAVGVLMDSALALLSPAQKRGQKQQNQQQQQQHLTVCLEAATLACAVVARTVGTSLAVAREPVERPDAYQRPDADLCFTAVGSLLEALAKCLQASPLSYEQLNTALAAAEAALRLAACLPLKLQDLLKLPGLKQVGSEALITQVSSQLLAASDALVTSVIATLLQPHSSTSNAGAPCCSPGTAATFNSADGMSSSSAVGGNTLAGSSRQGGDSSLSAAKLELLACHASYMAASAVKLALLQALATVRESACRGISIDLCLDVVDLVLLVHTLQSRSCDTEQQALLDRKLTSILHPLLPYLLKLGTSFVLRTTARRGPDLLQHVRSNMEHLPGLLAKLDALPCSAGLPLQIPVMTMLLYYWQALHQFAVELPGSRRQLSPGAPGTAAGQMAKLAVEWRRSACLAVTEGLLKGMAAWAEDFVQTEGRTLAVVKGLQDAWMLFVAVANQVVAQRATAAAGTAPAGLRLLQDIQGLSPARQRKQLSSPRFWQQVQRTLLPALDSLARSALGGLPPNHQLLTNLHCAPALATRICANPACLNIWGCSEGLLRSRRCSGCGLARYCTRECQVTKLSSELHRLLEGALLALIKSLESVAASQPAVCPAALAFARSADCTSDLAAVKLYCMAGALGELDLHPCIAALGFRQRVARLLCDACQVLVAWVEEQKRADPEIPCWVGKVASRLATFAREWTRSAGAAVQEGLLEVFVHWALEVTQSPDKHRMGNSLKGAWLLLVEVLHALASQFRSDQDGHSNSPLSLAIPRAAQPVDSFNRLPASKQRKQLASHSFWAVEVQQRLLPELRTLAAAVPSDVPAPSAQEALLRVSTALATRVCANSACINVRGCSEGRLRSRRCSGCGLARYCCRACQVCDLEAHGRVCRQLRKLSEPVYL